MYFSVCINQMLPEKFSCMLANFYLLCLYLHYSPTLRAQIQNGFARFAFWENMWAREKNLEPPSAWNCCIQTCSADSLGHPSGLSSFREQMRKHFLPGKRVPKPLDYTACSFYRSRLLGRGGKQLLGSGRRKEYCSLILLTASAVWTSESGLGKYSRYLRCH